VIVQHPVADFDTWKVGFDDHEHMRVAAGILGHHINCAEDDPNSVSIYLAVADIEKAKAFAESDELKETMEKVGVTGPPTISWMTPVRESIVWDRQLPAFIIGHSVADFDAWLEGYDAADELRTSSGIIGHAANRSLDDPSLVVVYHQAESFDTLRAFLDNPDLRAAMEKAGVTSEPEVSFHNGGWAKMYG
jgi:quinol monooxygenase YgiN